ncbi:YihA family ribosome biogenesis GTP-binding protein [Niabella ginsenosidivorans]|uniref:Probable GTP-binding protein EngB n=1 Tax=Niabella ginsenosidivorans TaxID=1176587 RepID=A0A1A9I182_9BACT|nr:ribosome biogenesis GTP-binding protein YihA/YsxC [Niabella ginsenosidivorans]ANH80461.1 YihA family ribosome biogenesis GTP-binding protein [Niabella ginsenosidivorans]
MEVISATYLKSSAEQAQCPVADRPEYAFIGRSNVGKSSLINMLCNKKGLAKTSAAPGKTQLINHFEVITGVRNKVGHMEKSSWFLVDLPGYGYAKVSQKQRKNWSAMIEKYILKRKNLVNMFVLIDSRHEPQPIDIEFINQLGEWRVPFALVFTKADKNKPAATVRNVDAFLNGLKESWEELPVHFVTSAIDKRGRGAVLDYIAALNGQLQ